MRPKALRRADNSKKRAAPPAPRRAAPTWGTEAQSVCRSSATLNGAPVHPRRLSTSPSAGIAVSTRRESVTSNTARLVMIWSTTPRPVSGSEHSATTLGAPSLATCPGITTPRRVPAADHRERGRGVEAAAAGRDRDGLLARVDHVRVLLARDWELAHPEQAVL